ncbi:MAG: hypothetical protein QM756_02285 [Polyangiaceae bacterium]
MHRFASLEELTALRNAAVEVTASAGRVIDATHIWQDLTQGKLGLLDTFTAGDFSYLVATRELNHAPLSERALEMLERVLLGACPKQVASDFRLAQSTLAESLKLALRTMGASCLPSKVPFGLVALARQARAQNGRPLVHGAVAQLAGFECLVLATRLPSLSNLLPPAIEQVLRLHAEGKTHREIASLRGKSQRTIANQLATAFQRIGNSGRINTIEFLLSVSPS